MTVIRQERLNMTKEDIEERLERGLWNRFVRLFEIPNTPFALDWDEWEAWYAKAKNQYPVRFRVHEFLSITLSRWWRICVREPIWWVRYRLQPRHRYHVVRTGLKPGYYDKDVLLLHACFNLLVQFVEREKPFDHFDTESSHNAKQWRQIRELYDWWKARKEPDFMEGDYATDQKMLHRLINVRRHLWT